jgi:hypothetical protein
MTSTPEQLDQIINDHFMFEATDNVDGVLGTLAETVEHEVVPSPMGASRDKKQVRDGKITREQAWCDLAAIQQQLGCKVSCCTGRHPRRRARVAL